MGAFDVGDQISVGAATTRPSRDGIDGADRRHGAPALTQAHLNRAAVLDFAGPSGLIMKAVVDHADGSRQTFVTDGTWRISKATQYTTTTVTYAQRRLRRQGRALRRARRDRRLGHGDLRRLGLAAGLCDRPAPAPGEPAARGVQPPASRRSHSSTYEIVHPKSVTTLADGSVIADFGTVIPGVPQLRLAHGQAGRALVMQTSFRLNNTTLAAAATAGATSITVASAANFVAGDRITIDQGADGFGAGDPEARTIAAVNGTTDHARRAAEPHSRERPLRRRRARRDVIARHAGLQPRLVVHGEGRRPGRAADALLGLALPADPAARRG